MRVHFLSIFASEPVGGGGRVRYGGGTAPGRQRSRLRGAERVGGQWHVSCGRHAGAGWLFLFVVLLIVPARRGRTRTPAPGDVPPAVVSLLARRLERSGFGATLVDLAARGWFEVRAPGRDAGRATDAVRAARGGARGVAGGRPRRGSRPGPVGRVRRRPNRVHVGVPRAGRRRGPPGNAGLAASGGGGGRVVAYAAALGAAPAALAVFAQGSSNVAPRAREKD